VMDDFEDYMRAKRSERDESRRLFWKEFGMTGVVVAGGALLLATATLASPAIHAFLGQ